MWGSNPGLSRQDLPELIARLQLILKLEAVFGSSGVWMVCLVVEFWSLLMVSLRCLFDWFVQLVVGGGAALRCYRIELVLVSGARDMCIGVVDGRWYRLNRLWF